MIEKLCPKCNLSKSLSDFGKDKNRKDKLQVYCKECLKSWHKLHYKQNKDKINERAKKYREENSEKIKERNKKYNEIFISGELAQNCLLKLTIEELPEIDIEGYLTCICTKCKERFRPKYLMIKNRISILNGKGDGESRLYCSDECKNSCDVFNKQWNELSDEERHIQDELRYSTKELKQMCVDIDGEYCQLCETTDKLELHHIKSVRLYPHLSSDITNVILFCNDCHMNKIHKISGCSKDDLKCKIK